jgi:hypothetical protein
MDSSSSFANVNLLNAARVLAKDTVNFVASVVVGNDPSSGRMSNSARIAK